MLIPPPPPLETDEDRKRVTDLFKPINIGLLNNYARLYNDPCVKIATSFVLNGKYCSGVSFERKAKQFNEDARQWLSHTYQSFGRDVMRWYWICGFAACTLIDYGELSKQPVAIDLTQVITMYYKPPIGRPEFRFFLVTDDSGGPSPFQEISNEITGVTVFIMDTPPDRDGGLNSTMSVLQADIEREHDRMRFLRVAEEHRANPRVVLQVEQAQHSDKKLMNDVSLPLTSQSNRINTADANNNWQKYKTVHETASFLRKVNNIGLDKAMTLVKDMIENEPETVTLPTGRTYVAAQVPESPENVLEWRNARMETVAQLFHTPMPMFSQSSTSSAGETGSNKTSKGSENNSVMFNNAIKRYKVDIIALFRHMYKEVFRPVHVAEFFTKMKEDGKNITDIPDAERLVEAHVDDIQIRIPGAPDQSVLDGLYVAGVLKYRSYCSMTAEGLEIDASHFNPFPLLSIKEANGIQPKPPATGGSTGSKRKSTSSSSSSTKKKKSKTTASS